MATGVLGYIRGIDFSHNDFSRDQFPHEVGQMQHATWLKLNDTSLERVPDELSNLTQLEHLQMTRNKLQNVHGELSDLPRLRSVIFRRNQIKTSGIPTDIFRMKDLTIIDFSHNSLRDVPSNVEYAKCAIVLNLSHNNIETVPNQVFNNLIDLIFLDLSHNKLDALPAQIRRLVNLQVLNLSDNPLKNFHLSSLTMKNLRVLRLRNTNRTGNNLPLSFEDMSNISELDLSGNDLSVVPEAVFTLKKLRKLDLSRNKAGESTDLNLLSTIDIPDGAWTELETLNVAENLLEAFPNGITQCVKLQRFYANFNRIVFEGMPASIGKLMQLQVLYLSHNQLKLVPEGITRCVKLQKVKLDNNALLLIPDGMYLLPDLKELDLTNNPELVMPPRPQDRKQLAFYNVDFSLSHRMNVQTSASNTSSTDTNKKDAVQRKKEFIRRRRHQADENGASKAMSKMAKDNADTPESSANLDDGDGLKAPPTWRERMASTQKKLDFTDIFEADVGQSAGIWVWEIENFYPSPVDPEMYGSFFEADCYIVLKTTREDSGNLSHQIHYWIGDKSTLDKGMCAAVHSVNLLNHLGSTSRTVREEMNDESDVFLEFFDGEIEYVSGGRTQSGFFTVQKPKFATRLFRGSVDGKTIVMEPVPLSVQSLDPRYVFLLHTEKTIWIWRGFKSSNTVSSKVRLFAEKLNKRDRKGAADIEVCNHKSTPPEFWEALSGSPKPPQRIPEHLPAELKPPRSTLYVMKVGMGSMELPQVEVKGALHKDLLNSGSVYILDCGSDLFLWMGKRANRLLKLAGQKMSTELLNMIKRPDYTTLSRECEGEESTWFRSKFRGWDDVIPVDYTMTAETVQRRGADIKVIMQRDKMKVETDALFTTRMNAFSHEESEILMEECNADLEVIESFVLEKKKFIKLPQNEFGIFYTKDCYVFLCRYYVSGEDSDFSDEEGSSVANDSTSSVIAKKEAESTKADDFKCVVYFWQGRDASNMGWLNFTFILQASAFFPKKFETLFKDKLEVVRLSQQQENHKFLSHFKRQFLICRGSRIERQQYRLKPQLFHMRANGSSVNTRTIEVDCSAQLLNSAFCYVLACPFSEDSEDPAKDEGKIGRLYVWIGSKADGYYHELIQSVASKLLNHDDEYEEVTIREGEETEEFWRNIGGRKKYSKDADFMNHTRLFRCSNEKGHFSVSEKTVDFCQDDLDDDDVMIVDSGKYVFLWCGGNCSEVEGKLAYQAVQAFVNNNKMKGEERQLLLAVKGMESKRFRELFHGWSHHRQVPGS
ncbi:hypothetical protein M3Y99_00338000 [Aphelenchoides fujianensis]|nr:hypothetical protein M3Y99_00338000 [Aphelenchoides fujianensis]